MEDYSGIPMPSLRRSALVAPPAPLLSKRAAHTTAFAAHLPPGKGPESPLVRDASWNHDATYLMKCDCLFSALFKLPGGHRVVVPRITFRHFSMCFRDCRLSS